MTSSRPGYRDETSNSVLSKTAEQTNCDRIAKVPSRNSISSTFRKLVKRRLAWSFAGAAGAPGRQVFPREVGRRGTTSRNWEEARAANVFEMPPPWSNFRVLSRIRLRERDPPQFRKVTFFPARCSSPLSPLPRSRTIPNTRHAAVSVPSGDSFQRDSSESCGRTPSRQRKLPGKNRWLEWRELCQKNKISRKGGGEVVSQYPISGKRAAVRSVCTPQLCPLTFRSSRLRDTVLSFVSLVRELRHARTRSPKPRVAIIRS